MVTIEQKLVLFSKLLDQSMNLKYEEELKKLEKDIQLKIQKSMEEVNKQAHEIEERAKRKAESKHAESISKSKVIIKRDIMTIKEKYFDIFMKSFKERLNDFVQSKDYKTYLSKNISKINNELKNFDKLDLIVNLSTKDFNKYGDFIKTELNKNYEISFGTSDMIGGFIVEVPSENIKYDLSIENTLEDNKTYIMQTLFEALKAGEYND